MEELSFYEKVIVLYENILDHPLFILLIFVPIIMFFLHRKHGKKVFVIVYFLVIFILLLMFGDIIFKLFDNLMDGLFMFLYFPNFITLFGVVVACCLLSLISLFSKKMSKVKKLINYISFGLIQSLFALILITVRINKINIYKDNALYTNQDVLTLMQFLIGIFSIEVLSLIIISLVDRATKALDDKANISFNISKQVENLSKTKVKSISIDNNKVGFINVADKSLTGMPVLKPFKFDINKIESITFADGLFSPRTYNTFNLDNKNVSYYNEIVPKKLFNKIDIDFNKYLNLAVPNKFYSSFKLDDKDVYYLNEIIKVRKFKMAFLDSNKFVYLNVKNPVIKKINLQNKDVYYLNEVIKIRKFKIASLDSNKFVYLNVKNPGIKKINLQNKDVYYLNEVIKDKKMKPFVFDSNKIISIDVPRKSFNVFRLDSNNVSYLNEIIPEKKYNIIDLDENRGKNTWVNSPKSEYKFSSIDYNKKANIDLPSKPYKNVDIDSKPFSFFEGNVSSDSLNNKDFSFDKNLFKENRPFNYNQVEAITDFAEKPSEYEKIFNSKPNLSETSFNDVNVPKKQLVDNLKIIDIQSTLDTIVKCHLMVGINIYSYDKLTVSNLEICNFKLLSKVINSYKIYKK